MEDENKFVLEQFRQFVLTNSMENFYDSVVKALEKQIPVNVRHPIDMNCQENKLVAYCYSCGKNVKDMKYCPNCGQKLGWN